MPLTVYTYIRHTLIMTHTYIHIRKRASGEPQTAQALPHHNCDSCSPTLNTGYLYSYITQVQTKIIQGHHSHHTYLIYKCTYISILCICTAPSVALSHSNIFMSQSAGGVGLVRVGEVGAGGWGLVWVGEGSDNVSCQ